jgi:hypothetical protein
MNIQSVLTTNTGNPDAIFNDKHRAIKNQRLMQWAKWATFGLYIVAVFMLYVADVWGIGTFIEQKSNDWVALIVFSVIAFTLAFFLASSKEAVYEDIAIHRSEGYKLKPSQIVAMGLFLTSGLLFELFSTSNNQQHIANSAAENSAMFKSVSGSDVSLSAGSTALTQDLQAAQMRLADCNVRKAKAEAKGKTYDCAQSEANLAAVRESMAMSNQLAQQTNAQALEAKTDAMLKVREHFDKPMFQVIGKAMGTDNNTGMMIVIGVLIFIFECQHIMALFAYANALRRMKSKGGNIASDKPRSNQDAYNVAPALSAFDSAKMSVAEYAQKVESGLKASPEIIANEYARAQHGRNQAMETMSNAALKIGNKIDDMTRERFFKLIYTELRARILNGDLQPETQPATDAVMGVIQHHTKTLGLQPATLGKADCQKIAKNILEKLNKEGVIQSSGNGYAVADKWRSDAPVIKSVTGFKQSPDQAANVSKLYQAETAKHEAGEVFNDSPTPSRPTLRPQEATVLALNVIRNMTNSGALPLSRNHIISATRVEFSRLAKAHDLPDMDHEAAGMWIYNVLKKEQTDKPKAEFPADQRKDGTGIHSPVLGKSEAIFPLPLPAPDRVEAVQPPPASTLVDTLVEPCRQPPCNLVDNPQQGQANKVAEQGQQGEQKPNIDDVATHQNRALDIIWQGIDKGIIDKVSVSDTGKCQRYLKGHGIGKSNPQRRELLTWVFDALNKEGVITENPEYTDPKCGRDKWLINQNRSIKYAA